MWVRGSNSAFYLLLDQAWLYLVGHLHRISSTQLRRHATPSGLHYCGDGTILHLENEPQTPLKFWKKKKKKRLKARKTNEHFTVASSQPHGQVKFFCGCRNIYSDLCWATNCPTVNKIQIKDLQVTPQQLAHVDQREAAFICIAVCKVCQEVTFNVQQRTYGQNRFPVNTKAESKPLCGKILSLSGLSSQIDYPLLTCHKVITQMCLVSHCFWGLFCKSAQRLQHNFLKYRQQIWYNKHASIEINKYLLTNKQKEGL